MKPKVIGLDFDGVVTVAGESAKQDGWKILLAELKADGHPACLEEVFIEAQERFVGKSAVVKGDRYDILWAMWRSLGYSGENSCNLVKDSARRYDQVTRQLIVRSGVSEDTRVALADWQAKNIPVYVISATPQDALAKSVSQLRLEACFKEILGFPKRKPAHIREILMAEKINPEEFLFVGDSPGDHKAAQEVRCGFVGVSNDFNKWGPAEPFPIVTRLTEINILVGL